MDVAITASSPGAISNQTAAADTAASNADEARRAQQRKDAEDAQRRLDEQRAEQAREAQARQTVRNTNGEVTGTTINTTA